MAGKISPSSYTRIRKLLVQKSRNMVGEVVKVKVKVSPCLTKHHAVKAYWGSGGIAPLIL
jgi:hypothetical protein